MNLVREYEMILKEYDTLLYLSLEILKEIKGGMAEETLVLLLGKKQKIANNIDNLSRRITQTGISEAALPPPTGKVNNGQTLIRIKSLLEQIRSRVECLLKIEKEIENALKEKGIV